MWTHRESSMLNQEVKGNLARLLATENLVVEHRQVSTASFDVLRRVLTLPRWDKASSTVYDLLVGHEVGHALFTPSDKWDFNVPKDFINVVEDARIEKLMKRKYAGLSKDFYNGYQELNDQDFFGIADEDVAELPFIDRINLHFKVGAYARVPISEGTETELVKKVADCETFDDVLAVCREICDYIKQKQEEKQQAEVPAQSQEGTGETSKVATSKDAEEEKEDDTPSDSSEPGGEGDQEQESETEVENSIPTGGEFNEEKSMTQRAFDEAAEELNAERSRHMDPVYLELPQDVDTDKLIAKFDDLFPYMNNFFDKVAEARQEVWGDVYEQSDSDYKDFKKSAQKEVNYLVKEFEMRKSADSYARAGQSKTGVLDTTKLHTYKYNDDVFKKITVLPDGKNHGMIFVLDWSGSMGTYIMDTIKQLMNLVWFCKKVQIPFEVYAFTYEWNHDFLGGSSSDDIEYRQLEYCHTPAHNTLSPHKRFGLLNFLTSTVNSKDLDAACRNLFRLARYYTTSSVMYSIPLGLELSGTPLNDSIIALHKIIPQFQRDTKTQKVSVCILTDGESANVNYNVVMEGGHIGNRSCQRNCHIRDRKLGRVYRHFDDSVKDGVTTILLENLKDNFPQVNLIGFRIGNGNDFGYLHRSSQGYNNWSEDIIKKWRKQKNWVFNQNVGYDSLYMISNTTLSANTEFDVEQGAKKTAISKSFRSMLKNKTVNKKILSSFATVIS